MVLLKTDASHIRGVLENAKHAADGQLREMAAGGIALIQVTATTSRTAAPRVEYAMTYVRCYPDLEDESLRIWKRSWRYIIEGANIYRVRRPFDIRRVKVSSKNYGQGAIRFAYVDAGDAREIRQGGYLEPIERPQP